MTAALDGCASPLSQTYDVALLDLDGVVYIGKDAAPYAVDALVEATQSGMRTAYLTNNASRAPADIAAQLSALGIAAIADDVVTAAQAAAALLAERLDADSAVLVAGAAALRDAVTEAGLRAVSSADEAPRAVVMGYDPTLDYARLAEAALAIRRGALFVASNLDATLPTARGPLPGMGSLAALVITATGQHPVVAGKPERPLFDQSIARTGATRPLVIGDRLDTDIEGANRSGLPSLLVMTGVSNRLALACAPAQRRPTFVAPDLSALFQPQPASENGHCGEAMAEYDADARHVVLRQAGSEIESLCAIATAGWAAVDAGQTVLEVVPSE